MNDSKPPEETGWGDPVPELRSPDYYCCRGRRTGWGDCVACLEAPPHDCGYALHLGEEFLCLHPDHLLFAERTEAAQLLTGQAHSG